MDKPEKPDTFGVDGDVVAYAVAFKSQSEGDSLEDALSATTAFLRSIINACGDTGIIYLTGNNNFRFKEALPAYPYKGSRKDNPKPAFLTEIRQFMIDEYDAEVQPDQEADDALAIAACTKGHGIATIDKDLDGCPGYHYNWRKDSLYYVSEVEADRFFYTQMLTGDATDDIPGLFKMVGKKATAKLKSPLQELTKPEEMYAHVRNVYLWGYHEVGMCEDTAEETVDRWLHSIGRCLWMRRKPDEMWEAPTWDAK